MRGINLFYSLENCRSRNYKYQEFNILLRMSSSANQIATFA